MKTKNIYKWHRRIAIICVLFILTFTVSGLSRTIDKNIAEPAQALTPTETIDLQQVQLNPAQALTRLNDAAGSDTHRTVQSVECRAIDGKMWWQFIIASVQPIMPKAGQFGPPLFIQPIPIYVDAQTGALAGENLDRVYAQRIAEQTLQQPVTVGELITGFTMEYGFIDRMHPVYRCTAVADPSEVLYVSTMQGVSSKYMNTRKRWGATLFMIVHKYFIIRNRGIRETLVCGLAAVVFVVAASGLWLWWRMRRIPAARRPALHRWHARVGLLASVLALVGSSSGVMHTVMVYFSTLPEAPVPRQTALRASDTLFPVFNLEKKLEHADAVQENQQQKQYKSTIVAIGLRRIAGRLVYQCRYAGLHAGDYVDAHTGTLVADGEQDYVRDIASPVLGHDVEIMKYHTTFSPDYPMINKFLPVYQCRPVAGSAAAAQGHQVFVSPMTGAIPRTTDAMDRFNQSVFQNLHSWVFLPEPFRSMWMYMLGASLIGTSLSGVYLFFFKSNNVKAGGEEADVSSSGD